MSQSYAKGNIGPTGPQGYGATGIQGVTGPTGPQGPGTHTGSATINFGAAPGTNTVSVTVTGQAAIISGSMVTAAFMAEASTDHTVYEHTLIGKWVSLSCGNIVAATGFDITAMTELRLTGTWTVRWFWV